MLLNERVFVLVNVNKLSKLFQIFVPMMMSIELFIIKMKQCREFNIFNVSPISWYFQRFKYRPNANDMEILGKKALRCHFYGVSGIL